MNAHVTPMMAQYLEIKARIPTRCCSTGWAISTRCSSTTPSRGRGAGHRADQARQAPGRGHPDVRRAGACRRKLPADADPQGFPRRRLRADGGPGRGQETRRVQGRGAARGRAAGHARHADRGHAARRAAHNYLAAWAEIRGRARWPGRYLDRRFHVDALPRGPVGAELAAARPREVLVADMDVSRQDAPDREAGASVTPLGRAVSTATSAEKRLSGSSRSARLTRSARSRARSWRRWARPITWR
jgi:hypothetical protein